MQTVTLQGEDFKIIHNTLCDLRNLVQRMDESMIKTSEFERIIEGFQMGLKDAYDQDMSQFNERHDSYQSVARKNGFESIWSMYDISDLTLPHCYGKDLTVSYNGCEAKVEGHTWVDIWRAADKVITESGDDCHIFIEDFIRDNNVLKLQTGS